MRIVLKHLLGRGGTGALTKPPSGLTPCPALTPGSLSLDWARGGGGGDETNPGRATTARPPPLRHPRAAFSPPKKRGAGSRPRPDAGPAGGEGAPAAGGGRRAHSPATAPIVTRPQLHRVRHSGGAAPGGAAAGKPRRRPRSPGQPPAFFRPAAYGGGGAAAARVPRHRRPAEGPRVAEARPQLKISCWRRRRRGRSLGGEREGGDPQEAANATECLHTSLRLPWLVKEPSGSQRGGRVGWGESGGRA